MLWLKATKIRWKWKVNYDNASFKKFGQFKTISPKHDTKQPAGVRLQFQSSEEYGIFMSQIDLFKDYLYLIWLCT